MLIVERKLKEWFDSVKNETELMYDDGKVFFQYKGKTITTTLQNNSIIFETIFKGDGKYFNGYCYISMDIDELAENTFYDIYCMILKDYNERIEKYGKIAMKEKMQLSYIINTLSKKYEVVVGEKKENQKLLIYNGNDFIVSCDIVFNVRNCRFSYRSYDFKRDYDFSIEDDCNGMLEHLIKDIDRKIELFNKQEHRDVFMGVDFGY